MSLVKYIALGASLVVLSTAALAFQEQNSGSSAPVEVPAAQVEPVKPVELASPGVQDLKPSVGTEVRIPGLGKLGNLPKMDFGLELLYGASGKQPEMPATDEPRDDLTIRGTVKHTF